MALRGTPSVRRLRLGTELRRLRDRAGLTATEGARLLGISQAQLSNIEASRFGVSPERLHAMARNYRCSDTAYIQGLLDLAGERTPGWWETFREVLPAPLLDIAELEHHATGLQSANTSTSRDFCRPRTTLARSFGRSYPSSPVRTSSTG